MIADGAEIRVQGFWHGSAEGIGFWLESYAKELWTSELHHVFALDTLSGGYLGYVSDVSGSLCLVTISYLDIYDSWTDKLLWLDGYI